MKKFTRIAIILVTCIFATGCSTTTAVDEDVTGVIEEVDGLEEADGLGEVDELEEAKELVPFGSFAATTTTGEEVTEAIFAEYDITMVNIWATWCSPCVNEMDELQEVYAGLADNVNMISICYDGGTETDLANEILSENNAEFMAIIPDSGIATNILSSLQYFPTTIFVDRDGNIVGDRLEGAPSANVVAVYNAYIEGALATVE